MVSGRVDCVDLTRLFPEAGRLATALRERGLTVATAESCTGGMIAAALSAAPDATDLLQGGVVAYSQSSKVQQLGIPDEILDREGTVSEEVARRMAVAVRERFAVDLAISCTGLVGGPDEGKPAGLIFVAVATAAGVTVERLDGDHGPAANCHNAVSSALALALKTAAA